jgi:hypothetical protein
MSPHYDENGKTPTFCSLNTNSNMYYNLAYAYQWYDESGNLVPSWVEFLPPTLQLLHESLTDYYEQLAHKDDSDSEDSADSTLDEENGAEFVVFDDDYIEYEASDLSDEDEVEVEEAIISTMLHHA